MATDNFNLNSAFLKNHGKELIPTGAMFTPYDFENDSIYISLDEYSNLRILNKETGKSKFVNMVTQIIEESDLSI
jgi:hypothetical protein